MTDKKVVKKVSWPTLVGTIFALIVCITASSMIYIVYPQSIQLLRIFFRTNEGEGSISAPLYVDLNIPTPFQPISTEITLPTPTLLPDPPGKDSPNPTPTQQPPSDQYVVVEDTPDSANISGIYGSPQLYTLDCEAQSAVDWARFFGVNISELEFIDLLPLSDDPTQGFVGDINGAMGRLPPDDYGVHAAPVAALLHEYGLNAQAVSGWDLDDLKKEIAAGRPVIIWTVNLPYAVETSQYTASNGNTTTVARYEHTWIITGYNQHIFTVVDSEWTYNVKYSTLIERWGALGNQAVIYGPD